MRSCVESKERVARKRFRSRVDDDRIATQRGEQAVGAGDPGRVGEGALELGRAVQRVHRLSRPINRRIGICHVVADEPNGIGNRAIVDVRRRDPTAPLGQSDGDVGSVPHADLDEFVVSVEASDESRVPVGVHAGMFINGAI